MVAAVLGISSAIVDRVLGDDDSRPAAKRWLRLRMAVKQTVFVTALIAIIAALAVLTLHLESISLNGHLRTLSNGDLLVKTVITTLTCLSIISNTLLLTVIAQLTWRPIHRAARSSMMLASVLQFIVGTLLVTVNTSAVVGCDKSPNDKNARIFAFHQHAGAIISSLSVLGFSLCWAIREGNRLNQLFTTFIRFYILLSSFTAALCIASLGFAIWHLYHPPSNAVAKTTTVYSDPSLTSVALILIGVCLVAANWLREPPRSHLEVEVMDLNALTPAQQDAYANLITTYGKLVPGAPNGEAAISMMRAYANSPLPNAKCLVLRVYKPSPSVKQKTLQVDVQTAWEYDRAWRTLDEEQMVFRIPPTPLQTAAATTTSAKSPSGPGSPVKLSRYQQKKLARKQANAAAKMDTLSIPIETTIATTKTPSVTQADLEFAAKLESTEALVLLMQVEGYDLTTHLKGWPGRILQRFLGSKSYLKLLSVRLGLLAFHWPFRQATFYCSYARRPVARTAAVMRAVSEWNKAQPKSTRCEVLLDPTYQYDTAERAIVPSGWLPSPLPSSHIIDLRPHKGKTLTEYLKAINYRNQENAFKKAGGQVEESAAFTPEECSEVMRLWRNIANKRTADGAAEVLTVPNEAFFEQLGSGSNGYRTLMFLKADGHTIASCVLFRLGDTITSDLQGLDYERAHPLKAYFVMMQEVIAIALREGHSFVDFGPTTAKPKMDIGCKSVPLIGAMHAVSLPISIGIRFAARTLTTH
jgi:hypothetical protein